MARIAQNVPLTAYDHVAKALQSAAGKDRIISRQDAKELVAELKKDGQGTEALIAKSVFTMADKRDVKAGGRVTGYDLNKLRTFVQEKMLERVDVNNNGYSAAEVRAMSMTGKALVELGRVLGTEKQNGRVSVDTVRAGMEHVAALINGARGADGVISRKDVDALIDRLYSQGRGTEGLAVAKFFTFVDARDFKVGARVTADDIARATAYSDAKLIKRLDTNHNGLSKSEIENMSSTGKAFVLIGRMLKDGITKEEKPAATTVKGTRDPAHGGIKAPAAQFSDN